MPPRSTTVIAPTRAGTGCSAWSGLASTSSPSRERQDHDERRDEGEGLGGAGAHAATPPPSPSPIRDWRYASMKGSISPSSTAWMSPVLVSVRRSFTSV